MREVVVVSACRTAIGAFGGSLKDLNAASLASVPMKEAVKRAGINPGIIDDVRFGCCMEPVDALNVTRVAALMAGIPDTVTAVTVNRVCISGMEAVLSGAALIRAEMADVILAGGVEHMSGGEYVVQNARWGCRLQDQVFCGPDHPCAARGLAHAAGSGIGTGKGRDAPGSLQGETLYHGTDRGICGPDAEYHPGGNGLVGPAKPQQRGAGHKGRGFQGGDRSGGDSAKEREAPSDF